MAAAESDGGRLPGGNNASAWTGSIPSARIRRRRALPATRTASRRIFRRAAAGGASGGGVDGDGAAGGLPHSVQCDNSAVRIARAASYPGLGTGVMRTPEAKAETGDSQPAARQPTNAASGRPTRPRHREQPRAAAPPRGSADRPGAECSSQLHRHAYRTRRAGRRDAASARRGPQHPCPVLGRRKIPGLLADCQAARDTPRRSVT